MVRAFDKNEVNPAPVGAFMQVGPPAATEACSPGPIPYRLANGETLTVTGSRQSSPVWHKA